MEFAVFALTFESIPTSIIALVSSYLIGSFPTAYIVARLVKGIDIREVGSRNMGAMNVIYSVGRTYGIMVLLTDVGKGIVAVFLARWLGTPDIIQLAAGVAAMLGHSFPVFLKFRGGKGGAVAVGVVIFLIPKILAIGLPLFFLLMWITRFPTLSYGLALASCPFVAWFMYHSPTYTVFTILLLLVLCLRYIPRLKEMRSKGTTWRRVIFRKSLKERL